MVCVVLISPVCCEGPEYTPVSVPPPSSLIILKFHPFLFKYKMIQCATCRSHLCAASASHCTHRSVLFS